MCAAPVKSIQVTLLLNTNRLFHIFPKVKGREKRSLASHLSGYIPPKRGQEAASPVPKTGEPPPRADDGVLSTVAVFTLS